jgi:hypothetical protein
VFFSFDVEVMKDVGIADEKLSDRKERKAETLRKIALQSNRKVPF